MPYLYLRSFLTTEGRVVSLVYVHTVIRTLARLVLALAMVVLFALRSPGITVAADNQQAPLLGPDFASGCTYPNPGDVTDGLGFVNFHLQHDGTVVVNDHVRNADPNATYAVFFWTGDASGTCYLEILGELTTNSRGVGNGTFGAKLLGPQYALTNCDICGGVSTGPNLFLSTATQTVS
jgi:hypothetical protein